MVFSFTHLFFHFFLFSFSSFYSQKPSCKHDLPGFLFIQMFKFIYQYVIIRFKHYAPPQLYRSISITTFILHSLILHLLILPFFSGHIHLFRLREMGPTEKGGIYVWVSIFRRSGSQLRRCASLQRLPAPGRAGRLLPDLNYKRSFSVWLFHPIQQVVTSKASYIFY